jgi:hypothetical protein
MQQGLVDEAVPFLEKAANALATEGVFSPPGASGTSIPASSTDYLSGVIVLFLLEWVVYCVASRRIAPNTAWDKESQEANIGPYPNHGPTS